MNFLLYKIYNYTYLLSNTILQNKKWLTNTGVNIDSIKAAKIINIYKITILFFKKPILIFLSIYKSTNTQQKINVNISSIPWGIIIIKYLKLENLEINNPKVAPFIIKYEYINVFPISIEYVIHMKDNVFRNRI